LYVRFPRDGCRLERDRLGAVVYGWHAATPIAVHRPPALHNTE